MTKWLKCHGNSQWDPVQDLIYVSWYPSNSNNVQKKRKKFNFFFWSFCPASEMQDEGKLRNWCPIKLRYNFKKSCERIFKYSCKKIMPDFFKKYTLHTFAIVKVSWIISYVFSFSMKSWLIYITSMFWIPNIHINGHRRVCHKIILTLRKR